ncbi:putative Histidine kinase [Desulfosarcina cetonica]|uniref:response regulator n=1 Tax=Desulfosarcina cetonica TaxID=90730 RepID=UPI00155D95F5|nr:response regulator [Desulfosarcina cetonica]VTR67531.1 putative Histidine kinase [Desulfosarcina cetonica]
MADHAFPKPSRNIVHRLLNLRNHFSVARLSDRVLLMGLGVVCVYWVFESILFWLTAEEGTFLGAFFNPGYNELLSRLLVLCFFMIFGSQVGHILRQRQALNEALAGSEEKHRTIIANIEDGYFEIDIYGKLTAFNDAFRNITGYAAEQLALQDYGRLLTPAETERVFGAFQNVRRTGRAIKDLGFVIVRHDGARRWVETSISPITSADGNLRGYRGILRDVTRRRQADALKQEKMAAEAASRSKSEFLANMSHEIRTPLNAIIGLVELLLASQLSQEQREDLKVVQSAAYALLSVINDILDFSKIEAGRLELERSPFNLRDFLGEALKILAVRAHEKRLELAYRVAPDVPDRLVGDHHRFRQVLLNLIGNAVKFTDAGEIVVFAQCESLADDRLVLHVAVRDTGAGIPTGKQVMIFEAFSQADGSTSRRYGGTGLGLAVSAQLVNLMGGRIWVKSTLGEGSVFHFTMAFDVDSSQPEDHHLPADIDLSRMQALVVDDNATNLKILCEMLSSWKITAKAATSAEEGRELIDQLRQQGETIDLALIDSDLDQEGALALIRHLHRQAGEGARITLMLTTTTAKTADRFQREGIANVVTKPVRPSDLLDAVIKALSEENMPMATWREIKSTDARTTLPPLDILVAEDTPFNQKYIRRLLDNWRCRTTVVANGRLAIEAWSHKRFDLILMDVQMPEMDGLSATARIRDLEREKGGGHIPIIAMTAHAMKGDRERCLDAGMDDYVPKPIASASLHKAIARLLPSMVGADPMRLPVADGGETALDDELAGLMAAFNNDGAFFKDVAGMFLSDYPPMLETLAQAIARQDGDLLRRTAHALKGMARNFQIEDAAATALQIEQMGGQGHIDAAAGLTQRLSDELARFEGRLKQMMARAPG